MRTHTSLLLGVFLNSQNKRFFYNSNSVSTLKANYFKTVHHKPWNINTIKYNGDINMYVNYFNTRKCIYEMLN